MSYCHIVIRVTISCVIRYNTAYTVQCFVLYWLQYRTSAESPQRLPWAIACLLLSRIHTQIPNHWPLYFSRFTRRRPPRRGRRPPRRGRRPQLRHSLAPRRQPRGIVHVLIICSWAGAPASLGWLEVLLPSFNLEVEQAPPLLVPVEHLKIS